MVYGLRKEMGTFLLSAGLEGGRGERRSGFHAATGGVGGQHSNQHREGLGGEQFSFCFHGSGPAQDGVRGRASGCFLAPGFYGVRKAPVAAPAAALAAAVRTVGLEKTPAANSSCAFWKLAPVRR